MSDDCSKRDMLNEPPIEMQPYRLAWIGIEGRTYLIGVAIEQRPGKGTTSDDEAEEIALAFAHGRHLRETGTLPPKEYTVVYMFPPGCFLGVEPGEIDCPASAEPQVVMAGARTISRRGDRVVVSIAQPGDDGVADEDHLPQD
jgi:hypothetical protein